MSTFEKARDFYVRLQSPFNGGPELSHLHESFLTPREHFFVRNHGEVPAIDPASHRLRVVGLVEQPLELSIGELGARFGRREEMVTLQCAGNRRLELMALRPIANELPWGSEAIGNARWAGVSLAAVLAAARPMPEATHVELVGHDETERAGRRIHFGGSIPLDKALGPEVLLATEMNGEPLAPVHGAPVRAVVPGYIGARSVKWLQEIRLLAAPSQNYFQAHAYRLFPAGVDASNVVWEEGLMLGESPVNSILTAPADGSEPASGRVSVRGVAVASGARSVARVEVSADGGAHWHTATLGDETGRWAWRQWRCVLDLPPGEHEIVARAWDTAAQTQPERVEQVWNFKGYVNNSWPRARVRCR